MLSNYERETIIHFDDSEDIATVYTCNRALQRKLSRYAEENKGYKLVNQDEDSQTYECSKKLISCRPPKVISEKTRERMRLLAKKRFGRVGADENDSEET